MSGQAREFVAAYLADHPDAAANETYRAFVDAGHRGRRTTVLGVYRELIGRGGPSRGASLACRGNQYLPPQGGSFGVPGVTLSRTHLHLPVGLDFADYERIGSALGCTMDMFGWAFGDWINFGEAAYGEKYAHAIEATGRKRQTLMNHASVARRVPPSQRRPNLSWSVHAELSGLADEERERWLELAEANGWSSHDVRERLRELVLPAPVEVVPEIDMNEEAAVLDEYRARKRDFGDWLTPQRMGRLIQTRARRVDREEQTQRIRAGALLEGERLRGVLRIGDGIEIHHADFATLDIEPGSVDLVFCDPPYVAEFAPRWTELGEFAAKALKPGRLIVAYTGNIHLLEALDGLGDHLEFVTLGSVFLPGGHTLLRGIQVFANCKPLAFFSNGPYKPRRPFANGYWVRKPEKQDHVWQQEAGTARYYIDQLTEPGQLVADPFLGSGTTAVAARDLGRRFTGCDVDPAAIETAQARLARDAA